MVKSRTRPEVVPQEDLDAVDSPPLSPGMLKQLRPASAGRPDLVKASLEGELRRRGPQVAPTKTLVSMRYSQEVLAHFRATGPGWQTRMDEALKQWILEHPGPANTSGR